MAGNSGGDEDEPVTWLCVLRPYYKDLKLLRCPMAAKPSVPEPGGEEPPGKTFFAWGVFDGSRWQYPGGYGSCGINAWCYNPKEELSYDDQAKSN